MKLRNVSIWKTCQVRDLFHLFYIRFNPIASTPPKSFSEVQRPIVPPAHTHTPPPLLLPTTIILLANDHQMRDEQISGPQGIANGPWRDHSTTSSNTYMDSIQTYCYGNICLSQLSCITNIQLPPLQSSTMQETGLGSLYCHFSTMTFDKTHINPEWASTTSKDKWSSFSAQKPGKRCPTRSSTHDHKTRLTHLYLL